MSSTWITRSPEGLPSFALVPTVALTDARMTLPLLRVFALLAAHANTQGLCYPSLDHLAKLCGFETVSARTGLAVPNRSYVSRLISQLVKLGYVTRVRRGSNSALCQLCVPDVPQHAARTRLTPDERATIADARRQHSEGPNPARPFGTTADGDLFTWEDVEADARRVRDTGSAPAYTREQYEWIGVPWPFAEVSRLSLSAGPDELDAGDFLDDY